MRRYQVKWKDSKPGRPVQSLTITYESPEEADVLLRYIEQNKDLDLEDFKIVG